MDIGRQFALALGRVAERLGIRPGLGALALDSMLDVIEFCAFSLRKCLPAFVCRQYGCRERSQILFPTLVNLRMLLPLRTTEVRAPPSAPARKSPSDIATSGCILNELGLCIFVPFTGRV